MSPKLQDRYQRCADEKQHGVHRFSSGLTFGKQVCCPHIEKRTSGECQEDAEELVGDVSEHEIADEDGYGRHGSEGPTDQDSSIAGDARVIEGRHSRHAYGQLVGDHEQQGH